MSVREELAAALRTFGRLGYEFGFNGHVSVRAGDGHYWVNPFGVSISVVTPEDIVLVDEQGDVVEGRHPINGFAGNLALHRAVAEAVAITHLHTPRGFIWSSLQRPLEAVNTDSALVVGLQGLGGSTIELAQRGARVIQQPGHGFVTWGESVGEAAFYLVAAERAADANLALLGVSGVRPVPQEQVDRWTLTPELARTHFEAQVVAA
jgi:ribulose-5-phosphate 4-epimerase/fuculose-1-phosphate aldolase